MLEELVVRAVLRDELSGPLTRTRREIRGATHDIEKMGAASETTGRRAGTIGMGLKRMGVGIAAVGLLAAGTSVKMAADFQQATNVLVTAAGETQAGLAQVRTGIRQIATETGTSFKDLEAGAYVLAKANYHGAASMKILRAAAQGAREENASLAAVTNAMTSVMASYHLGPDKAVQVMNALKTGAGQAKVTMEEFAASLSTVIPIASATGISIGQVFGAVGTLTQHGTTAHEATQEVAATIRGLVKMNRPQMTELAQLGLDPSDISGNLGKRGITGTLDLINNAILGHMTGPGGRVALSAFNQSQSAKHDLEIMRANMDPRLGALASAYTAGKITQKDWRATLKGSSTTDASLLSQYASLSNKANGFNSFVRSGDPAAQVYTGALARAMGSSIGLNTALQLVGPENAASTRGRVGAVTASLTNKSKDVEGWASTQKLLNVELDRGVRYVQSFAIGVGTALIPKVISAGGHFLTWAQHSAILAGDVDAVRSIVHDAGVVFSRDLLPPLKVLIGLSFVTISAGLHVLAATIGFIADHPTVGAVLVGLAAGMAAFKLVVAGTALINGMRYFIVALKGIAAAEGVIGVLRALTVGMVGLDTAMAANPVGIIVAALVGLGVAFTLAWKHSETFRDIVEAGIRFVGKAFLTYVDMVLWGIEKMLQGLAHLPKWLGGGIASDALKEVRKMRTAIQGMKDDLDRLGKPVVIPISAQISADAHKIIAAARASGASATEATRLANTYKHVGDTTISRVAGGNFARTMAFHAAIAGPGVKVTNAFAGGGGLGWGSGDHQGGRALDLIGPGLPSYAQRARDRGAFAEFHGNGPGRHLHVAVGDTSTSRAGGGDGSGGAVIMLTVQQTIEVTKAMPTEADVTGAAARGLIDATRALTAVGYTVVPGGRG